MWDIGNNFGKDRRCECGKKETVEHLVTCKKNEDDKEQGVKIEWLKETKDLVKIRMMNEYLERKIKERHWGEGKKEEKKNTKKNNNNNNNKYCIKWKVKPCT